MGGALQVELSAFINYLVARTVTLRKEPSWNLNSLTR